MSHDCVIGNLETVVRTTEGYPEAFPGGGCVYCTPDCLGVLKDWGFDMFATANNHSMDYGHGALLSTIKYLDQYGFRHAGTGENLAKASQACHFETDKGRIALLSVTSTFHDSYLAGPQNEELCGRPGVSPLRHKALYELPADDFIRLGEIASKSGINSYHDQARKEGYLLNSGNLHFGTFEFKEGTQFSVTTSPLQEDLERSLNVVKESRANSDIVVVSVHSHQFKGDKSQSTEFVEKFARQCCDSGADIVFCHGPHVIRGIEEYHGSIILYGLGNFISQHEGMEYLPEELYRKYGLKRCDVTGPQAFYAQRSQNGKTGLRRQKDAWYSFVASLEANDKEMDVLLYPIKIMQDEVCKGFIGMPCLSEDDEVLTRLNELSQCYGTTIDIDHNVGKIKIKRK